jgi:hypothetical protein
VPRRPSRGEERGGLLGSPLPVHHEPTEIRPSLSIGHGWHITTDDDLWLGGGVILPPGVTIAGQHPSRARPRSHLGGWPGRAAEPPSVAASGSDEPDAAGLTVALAALTICTGIALLCRDNFSCVEKGVPGQPAVEGISVG